MAESLGDASTTGLSTSVGTIWYAAPEILLMERSYGPAVDMWSAGCIMAELWTNQTLLQVGFVSNPCSTTYHFSRFHELQICLSLCGTMAFSVVEWIGIVFEIICRSCTHNVIGFVMRGKVFLKTLTLINNNDLVYIHRNPGTIRSKLDGEVCYIYVKVG